MTLTHRTQEIIARARMHTRTATTAVNNTATYTHTRHEQEIITRARMWRWKPYGEATIRYAQDGQGVPVELMQVTGSAWLAHS
jgi:hypothetical protein